MRPRKINISHSGRAMAPLEIPYWCVRRSKVLIDEASDSTQLGVRLALFPKFAARNCVPFGHWGAAYDNRRRVGSHQRILRDSNFRVNLEVWARAIPQGKHDEMAGEFHRLPSSGLVMDTHSRRDPLFIRRKRQRLDGVRGWRESIGLVDDGIQVDFTHSLGLGGAAWREALNKTIARTMSISSELDRQKPGGRIY